MKKCVLLFFFVFSLWSEKFFRSNRSFDVLFGFIGKQQQVVANLVVRLKLPKNTDERSNAGASRNEHSFTLIADSAENLMQDQLIILFQLE